MQNTLDGNRHISPWIYPAIWILFQAIIATLFILPSIARFSDATPGDILYFFMWGMAMTSDMLFPAGFTIALTLMFVKKKMQMTKESVFLIACGAGLLSTLIGFLLFGLFGSLSGEGAQLMKAEGFGALIYFFFPVVAGFFGILFAALLGIRMIQTQSVTSSLRTALLLFVFIIIAALGLSLQMTHQQNIANEKRSWYNSENPDDCLNFDENTRQGCYFQKATIHKNIAICDFIVLQELKDSCKKAVK